jgi:hypothetical protein
MSETLETYVFPSQVGGRVGWGRVEWGGGRGRDRPSASNLDPPSVLERGQPSHLFLPVVPAPVRPVLRLAENTHASLSTIMHPPASRPPPTHPAAQAGTSALAPVASRMVDVVAPKLRTLYGGLWIRF